ncbi:hypothetical protein KJI95_03855 [Shewanella sp. JM162201]|uniref:Permuted papain-like amidase enzyme, YaeF/YiiX, C92 family n=1 Tax=Shewanella jiangmenensis TaxID=2837387 RepID=A0ABS5UZM6_9GAMM|nr:YiiX/YebB-like N1pC/P60 family cysteine hydrolase [Shewanella jiangmenensis]MBT1443658.1 hypothetical protein [Shewanella jiangmenensis]
MKKVFCLLIAITVLLGCMARPTVEITSQTIHAEQNMRIKEQLLKLAKTGDWLVIRGYHATDNLVTNATGIPISHVGVFNRDSLKIVEAEGQGVHLSELDDFIDKSYRLIIIRPRWRTEANAIAAWNKAEKLVGSNYDFLGTIGFNYPNNYYCSELAVSIYSEWYSGKEKFPAVVKPGELYLWGSVLYDSLPRDEI